MTKQLYLEAIEALRQRVEALEESFFAEMERVSDLEEILEGAYEALDTYALEEVDEGRDPATNADKALDEFEDITLNEAIPLLMAWVHIKRNRKKLKEYVIDGDESRVITDPEPPPADFFTLTDAPISSDAWDWIAAGSDDVFWEDDDDLFSGGDWDQDEDDDDGDLWQDDPDYAPEYIGDDGEDDESGL